MIKRDIDPPTTPSYPVPPRTLHTLLSLAAENRPEKIPAAISRAIANTLRAEICFLVSIPDEEGNITIFEGFNLVAEEILPGSTISDKYKPIISEKLLISQPYWNNDPEDVSKFIQNSPVKMKSPILMCPVTTTHREPIGGVILLTPFSHRTWNSNDLIQLTAMVDTVAHILQRVDYIATLEEKLAKSTKEKLYQSSNESKKQQSIPETVVKLEEPIMVPTTRMGRIFQQSKHGPFYDIEAAMLLDEVTYLIQDLEMVKVGTQLTDEDFNKAVGGPYSLPFEPTDIDTVRSAVSAITGYADLLMSESAGPLNPLQKKFLTRIQVSTGKINQAVTSLENSDLELETTPGIEMIPFKQVVKKILYEFGTIIDQKKIIIDLSIPPNANELFSNRENIETILRKVFKTILFEVPVNGKIVILGKSVHQLQSKNGILCSIISSLQSSGINVSSIIGESEQRLESDLSNLLASIDGQVWINHAIHQEKTVHLFFVNLPEEGR